MRVSLTRRWVGLLLAIPLALSPAACSGSRSVDSADCKFARSASDPDCAALKKPTIGELFRQKGWVHDAHVAAPNEAGSAPGVTNYVTVLPWSCRAYFFLPQDGGGYELVKIQGVEDKTRNPGPDILVDDLPPPWHVQNMTKQQFTQLLRQTMGATDKHGDLTELATRLRDVCWKLPKSNLINVK
jgi:hypothetical protein